MARLLGFVFFLSSFHFSCAHQNDSSLLGKLSPDERTRLLTADLLLLGEKHDNPRHHEIQASIIDELGTKGRLGAVVFEQVSWSDQAILDKSTGVDELGKALNWDGSGWPPFAIYRPVFEKALRHKAKLIAGGLPKDKTMAIYKSGYGAAFSAEEQADLKLNTALPDEALKELKAIIFESHCRMIPEDHVAHMVPIQRARDAAMVKGWRRLAPPGKATVFILGAGHARKDFGVPTLVRAIDPSLKIWSLGLEEDGIGPDDAKAFDAQISSAPEPRPDPCEEMKKSLEKKKNP